MIYSASENKRRPNLCYKPVLKLYKVAYIDQPNERETSWYVPLSIMISTNKNKTKVNKQQLTEKAPIFLTFPTL